jgi:maltose-binding protein MalE
MKNLLKFTAAAAIVLSMASCTVTKSRAVSRAEIGEERGESKTLTVFGIEINGKYGLKEAARKGGITGPVAVIDEKVTSYVLFSKKTLIVTGKN